jgi:chaperone BCS1
MGEHTLNATMPHNVNGTSTSESSPPSLGSLLSLLLSLSALRDWLKLIVMGGFLETCRRVLFASYQKFIDSFFITANFQQDDSCYGMLLALVLTASDVNVIFRLDDGLAF